MLAGPSFAGGAHDILAKSVSPRSVQLFLKNLETWIQMRVPSAVQHMYRCICKCITYTFLLTISPCTSEQHRKLKGHPSWAKTLKAVWLVQRGEVPVPSNGYLLFRGAILIKLSISCACWQSGMGQARPMDPAPWERKALPAEAKSWQGTLAKRMRKPMEMRSGAVCGQMLKFLPTVIF